jgi:hypothetical protein
MKALCSSTLVMSLGLLAGLSPISALAEIGGPAGVAGAVQGVVSLQSPARQTPANDTISIDYSNQIDTAVVYAVNPAFGGPVTLTGAGSAPIVP